MSDHLPIEIQAEIMKRLSVKSLLQIRSVCKAWKSLIDNSDFIKHYSGQQQHLLVRYEDDEPKYVSIVDDDTFPVQKVPLTVPSLVNMLGTSRTIGSSHGLLCLYRCYHEGIDVPTGNALLWNLSLRKVVSVTVPNVSFGRYRTVLGFGVCRQTNDPKIVKIAYNALWMDNESIPDSFPWHVEVFTLTARAWRHPYSTNLPRKSLKFDCSLYGVAVDGSFYWLAKDRTTMGMRGELSYVNLIISFDITSEEFREINLPDTLAHLQRYHALSISKVRESLVVIQGALANDKVFHVWMMEDGVPKLFTKIFSICTPGAVILSVLEFRNSGEPVIEILDSLSDRYADDSSLVVYEPYSKHITNLGISGTCSFLLSSCMESCLGMSGMCSFSLYSYVETLLLLDLPDVTTDDI